MKNIILAILISTIFFSCAFMKKEVKKKEITKEDSVLFIKYLALKNKGKEIKKQEEILLNLYKKYPHSKGILKELIEYYKRDAKYDKMKFYVDELLKIDPNNLKVLSYKASIEMLKNRFPLKVVKKMHEIDPSNRDVLFMLGNYYYKDGDYKNAEPYFEQLVKLYGDKKAMLINVWLHLKKYEKIFKLVKKDEKLKGMLFRYFVLNKKTSQFYEYYLSNRKKLNKYEKAEFYYALFFILKNDAKEFIKTHPENRKEIEFYYASFLLENKNMNDDKEGAELFKKILKRSPKNIDAYKYIFKYAVIYKDKAMIKKYFSEYLKKSNDYTLVYPLFFQMVKSGIKIPEQFYMSIEYKKMKPSSSLAYISTLLSLKRYDEVGRFLKFFKTTNFKDEDIKTYNYLLLQYYMGKKDVKNMRAVYQNMIKLDRKNVSAMNFYAYSLLILGKNKKEALEILEKAYEIKKDDPAILDSLGWAYFENGDLKNAEKYIDMALKKMPNDAEILYHKAKIFQKKGKKKEAIEYMEKAMKNKNSGSDYIDFEKELKALGAFTDIH